MTRTTHRPGQQDPDPSTLHRAFVASLTGTALEWYDFAVYSATAALVFGRLFFPSANPLTSTLLAFSTYAVGYISRALTVAGVLLGRDADHAEDAEFTRSPARAEAQTVATR
jgi:hypothetical protein